MSSIRCSKCALVNFITADACKRCGSPLVADEGTQWETHQGAFNETYAQQNNGWTSVQHQASSYSYYAPEQPSSGSRSRKSIAIVIAAIVCVVAAVSIPIYLKKGKSAAPAASISWRDYSPEDGSYSVSMPGEVEKTTLERPTPLGTQYLHMAHVELGNKNGFGVIYSDMPPESLHFSPDRLLNGALDSLSNRQGMEILSRKDISLDGYKGMEVYLNPPASAKVKGSGIFRLYWVPPRVYIMAAGGPDSPEMEAARIKFLDSFKLLKK